MNDGRDALDDLLSQAARSGTDPGLETYDPASLLDYADGAAAPDVEAEVERELAASKSRRALWRALQDERHPVVTRHLRWAAPVAVAAAALLVLAVRSGPSPTWEVGPLPPGLAELRGEPASGPPRYGPEHDVELLLRTDTAGAAGAFRVYRVDAGGALRGIESTQLRRSEWVVAVRFPARAASAGQPGPTRIVVAPSEEDWSGRDLAAVSPLATRSYIFVP